MVFLSLNSLHLRLSLSLMSTSRLLPAAIHIVLSRLGLPPGVVLSDFTDETEEEGPGTAFLDGETKPSFDV